MPGPTSAPVGPLPEASCHSEPRVHIARADAGPDAATDEWTHHCTFIGPGAGTGASITLERNARLDAGAEVGPDARTSAHTVLDPMARSSHFTMPDAKMPLPF